MQKYDNNMSIEQPEERKRRNTLVCAVIALCFCAVLLLGGVLLAVTPDKAASENENRVLAQKPALTLSSLADGSFMRKFETYLTDQFPQRDVLITAKAFLSTLTGKREQNGVYFGTNGFLFEAQTPFDDTQNATVTAAIKAFAEQNEALQTAVLLSPNASCVLRDELPYGLTQEDQIEQLKTTRKRVKTKTLTWVSVTEAFSGVADKETLFYRTDHHWTTRAAFTAFLGLNDAWNLGAVRDNFVFYPVTDSFSGTLASSYGERELRDTIEVCIPKRSRGKYAVYYEAQGKKTATLFASEKLNQKNQYEVFLGGNFDKIVISTTADTENALLLFKDSYANCLIPMLTPFFSKIVVIDPRYFNDSLSAVMEETAFTHALFIYNLNTFLEDTSLAAALRS